VARFDVYAHPDPTLRRLTPYLLDIQNNHLERIITRVMIPLRTGTAFHLRTRDLNPSFTIAGKEVVADTAALGAFPVAELRSPVADLRHAAGEILAALDTLFGAY
jgi:toxin CcdB